MMNSMSQVWTQPELNFIHKKVWFMDTAFLASLSSINIKTVRVHITVRTAALLRLLNYSGIDSGTLAYAPQLNYSRIDSVT